MGGNHDLARVSFRKSALLENAIFQIFGITQNVKQHRGVAWDGHSRYFGCVELKFDILAAKTGNLFVEFCQTNSEGKEEPSGINLAKEQAQTWMVASPSPMSGYTYIYIIEVPKLLDLVENGKFLKKKTTKGVNGNGINHYAKGYIVPLPVLKDQCRMYMRIRTEEFQEILESA